MERYEEASSNQYSEDVQVLLRVKEQGDGKSLAYNTHLASFKPPVEVGHPRGSSHPGRRFTHAGLSSPESSPEEQEDPEGGARPGAGLADHRVQGEVHAPAAV